MILTQIIPKELKQFLIKKNAYNQCVHNMSAEMISHYTQHRVERHTLASLFLWNESPEDYSYWYALQNEYMEENHETNPSHNKGT